MKSYRFRRRAFITALSGGVGLKVMLRNLEGSAQGMKSPARLLVTHWPVGIVAGMNDALWKPTSGSVGGSQALRPFADLGLGPDMTVVRGLSTTHLDTNGGGRSEGGMVLMMTGRSAGGTRSNRVEGDDAFATGPSFDQILLKGVPALRSPGPVAYANSIADSRTDFGEVSAKCMSYSTNTQTVNLYAGGTATEAIPLMPVLSPLTQYTNVFGQFVPGTGGAGGTGGSSGGGAGGAGGGPPRVADAMLKKLVGKRSVLDFAIEELNQVKRLAPSDARNKLSIHTDAVVAAETSVLNAIQARYPDPNGGSGSAGSGGGGSAGSGGGGTSACVCPTKPPAPPMSPTGVPDPATGVGNSSGVGRDQAMQDDAPVHQQVGRAHMDVLRAAFICDIIRVGTYQWSPATNHVGFALMPNTTTPFQHHPVSHRISPADTTVASSLSGLSEPAVFLFNVHTWYFARHAENLAVWKNSLDGCGNNLLDYTCVPFVTEGASLGHERSNIPAMIIGGKKLGFLHDRYVTSGMTVNQFWGTIAQAFGPIPPDPAFGAIVPGFWAKP